MGKRGAPERLAASSSCRRRPEASLPTRAPRVTMQRMRAWLLVMGSGIIGLAACTSDTFTGEDASAGDAASDVASGDATHDAPIDAKMDGPSQGDGGKADGGKTDAGTDAGDAGSCLNGVNVVCPGTAPCCTLSSSPSYGQCVASTQCDAVTDATTVDAL